MGGGGNTAIDQRQFHILRRRGPRQQRDLGPFAVEDGDPHSLRHQAETARTVTVGDAFWSGPRDGA